MVLTFLLFALLVLHRHPDTPAARWLRRDLVERPVAACARMERHHWIAVMLLLGLGAAGLAAEVAWLLALDSAMIIDLTIAVWTASAARGLRTGWRLTGKRLLRLATPTRRRARARQPPHHRITSAANDDGDVRHAA